MITKHICITTEAQLLTEVNVLMKMKKKALNVRVSLETYARYKKSAKARKVPMAVVVREKLEGRKN